MAGPAGPPGSARYPYYLLSADRLDCASPGQGDWSRQILGRGGGHARRWG